jgi:hypothetical protein
METLRALNHTILILIQEDRCKINKLFRIGLEKSAIIHKFLTLFTQGFL